MGTPIWIEIPDEYPLNAGQHVKLFCEWATDNLYTRAAQWALIESNLQKHHPEFDVISFNNGPDFLTVEVVVGQPVVQLQTATITPLVILTSLGIVVLGIFGLSLLKYMSYLDTGAQTQYAGTTTAKMMAGSKFTLAIAALAAVVVFGLVKLK